MDKKLKEVLDKQLKELEEWKVLSEKPVHELVSEIFKLRDSIKKMSK